MARRAGSRPAARHPERPRRPGAPRAAPTSRPGSHPTQPGRELLGPADPPHHGVARHVRHQLLERRVKPQPAGPRAVIAGEIAGSRRASHRSCATSPVPLNWMLTSITFVQQSPGPSDRNVGTAGRSGAGGNAQAHRGDARERCRGAGRPVGGEVTPHRARFNRRPDFDPFRGPAPGWRTDPPGGPGPRPPCSGRARPSTRRCRHRSWRARRPRCCRTRRRRHRP